mmetsp:Transcript_37333/g.111839  ORF Transcript_37333/g.111839 Transcript_37333/m.111839 type:complete len:518 (+) Transcript_37333:1478-3031(+)
MERARWSPHQGHGLGSSRGWGRGVVTEGQLIAFHLVRYRCRDMSWFGLRSGRLCGSRSRQSIKPEEIRCKCGASGSGISLLLLDGLGTVLQILDAFVRGFKSTKRLLGVINQIIHHPLLLLLRLQLRRRLNEFRLGISHSLPQPRKLLRKLPDLCDRTVDFSPHLLLLLRHVPQLGLERDVLGLQLLQSSAEFHQLLRFVLHLVRLGRRQRPNSPAITSARADHTVWLSALFRDAKHGQHRDAVRLIPLPAADGNLRHLPRDVLVLVLLNPSQLRRRDAAASHPQARCERRLGGENGGGLLAGGPLIASTEPLERVGDGHAPHAGMDLGRNGHAQRLHPHSRRRMLLWRRRRRGPVALLLHAPRRLGGRLLRSKRRRRNRRGGRGLLLLLLPIRTHLTLLLRLRNRRQARLRHPHARLLRRERGRRHGRGRLRLLLLKRRRCCLSLHSRTSHGCARAPCGHSAPMCLILQGLKARRQGRRHGEVLLRDTNDHVHRNGELQRIEAVVHGVVSHVPNVA